MHICTPHLGGIHMRLYNNPGMNPLSPNWVIVFFLLLIVLQGIKDYHLWQVWSTGLALGGWQDLASHLQSTIAIPKGSQVSRTGEQHLNSLAGTGTGWLMSFERHLCQTKVIVFVIVLLSFWTLNLPRILEVSCSKSWRLSLQRCSLHKQVQSLKPQFVQAQPLKPQRASVCAIAGSKASVYTKQ